MIAAAAMALSSVSVIAVSGYSPTTATAVLQAQGTAPVIVGSLIDFWPLLAVGTLGVILGARRHHAVGSLRGARGLLLSCRLVLDRVLGTRALHRDPVRRVPRGTTHRPPAPSRSRAARNWPVRSGISRGNRPPPACDGHGRQPDAWLPAERIEIDQQPPLVGYVLADTGTSLLVLVDDDRHVVRLPADEVPSRKLCRVRTGLLVDRLPDRWRTLAPPYGLLITAGSTPGYPDCP